jgi:hypothetical protein
MVIDIHCHVGSDADGGEMSFDNLRNSMNRWGIDKSVVFSFSGSNDQMVRQSLDILEKSKNCDWVIPLLRVDPKVIGKDDLVSLLDKGFKGLKLHPSGQDFIVDDEEICWIYKLCEERGLPVLIHAAAKHNGSHPRRIVSLAEKFPSLKIIMAHFFGDDVDIMELGGKYPNLYTDISINSRTLRINQAVNKYGFRNLVFGSDIPYDSQGVALLKIKEAGLSKEDEDLILGGNAAKILGLDSDVVKEGERLEGDGK